MASWVEMQVNSDTTPKILGSRWDPLTHGSFQRSSGTRNRSERDVLIVDFRTAIKSCGIGAMKFVVLW